MDRADRDTGRESGIEWMDEGRTLLSSSGGCSDGDAGFAGFGKKPFVVGRCGRSSMLVRLVCDSG